ncbi:hypothetical protein [Nitrospirillum iridis]|uniref:Uncharacterized protein n=1 Tax=Nitrospirillum iridis TaxID=765888 RepID=A0A7X0B320_9PROT|nr:hypothetical protein [Nitrospirillum iridis]MBB6254782.1 hypothetical protein [Nitrospirillum iridis]
MPGKTSTLTAPRAPSPVTAYLRLLRGGAVAPTSPMDQDGFHAPCSAPQMTGGCGGGQMMAGRAQDPALVHF